MTCINKVSQKYPYYKGSKKSGSSQGTICFCRTSCSIFRYRCALPCRPAHTKGNFIGFQTGFQILDQGFLIERAAGLCDIDEL